MLQMDLFFGLKRDAFCTLMNINTFLPLYIQQFGKLSDSQIQGLTEIFSFLEHDTLIAPDVRKVSYVLATIKHECADTWKPIKERGGDTYFIQRYWRNVKVRKQLGNSSPQDAVKYCGRGYVQLTGRRNYTLVQQTLHSPVLEHPGLACHPPLSFAIAVRGMTDGWFTGKKLSEYITPSTCNYMGARKVINGTDKAAIIAAFAVKIEAMLQIART